MEFPGRDETTAIDDWQALANLLKSALGCGIFSMPAAFSNAGYVASLVGLLIIAFLTAHCICILVKCAHEVYKRTENYQMGYAEIGEQVFLTGPEWAKKYASTIKYTVLVSLFTCYYSTCSCYAVIAAENFNYILKRFYGEEINIRLMLAILLIPLLLIYYIPNLKLLAVVSLLSNLLIGFSMVTTLCYITRGIPPISKRSMFVDISRFPIFYSVVMFGIGCVGPVLPIENQMKTPSHLRGYFGVVSQGVFMNTTACLVLGIIGYLRYGDDCEGVITLNLPSESIAPVLVNLFVAFAMMGSVPIQMYIAMDIVWFEIKNRYKDHLLLANYILRTILITSAVGLSIAIPTVVPFVGLIGALTFSNLSYIFPAIFELVAFWDEGLGFMYWKIIKAVLLSLMGFLALIFGCKSSIEDIIKLYTD